MYLDDDLHRFEADGTPELKNNTNEGYVSCKNAEVWFQTAGEGEPFILLHGGLWHSGNWNLVANLFVEKGYQVILIDSRGHGHSTQREELYHYQSMMEDVSTVMDHLLLEKAFFLGWSDGAVVSLMMAKYHPEKVKGVYYFACNIHQSGAKSFVFTDSIKACISRHQKDYHALSKTPTQFDSFMNAVGLMQQNEPNYQMNDLNDIHVPIRVSISEEDKFITVQHSKDIARYLPNGSFELLIGVTHFAPLQNPEYFANSVISFYKTMSRS